MASKQKTIIVTGASQGIGAGVVQALLDRGYNVVANSRNISKSEAFKASDKLTLVDGNIGESGVAAKIVQTAVAKFGSIDGLVNNAGIFFTKPFTEYTIEDFEALSSVNLEGFLYVTQGAVKQMLAQKSRRQRGEHHDLAGGEPDRRHYVFGTDDHQGRHRGCDAQPGKRVREGAHSLQRRRAWSRRHANACKQSERTSSRLFRRWVLFRAWRILWT